jgi:galactokinase
MENEKRVGVNSGGMDQAASVISTTNSALYVSFFPRLSAEPIPLPGASITSTSTVSTTASPPPRAVFVCANSLVVSDKLVHARTRYNLRVVETLVAARVLARKLNISVGDREKVTLREVLGRAVGEDAGGGEDMDLGVLTEALERMAREVEVLKPQSKSGDGEEGVTLEEMIEWSGLSEEVFKEVYLSWVDVEATHFQLYKRAKHVFTEALRVLQFRELCLRASSSPYSSVLEELGKLMNESQESCSRVYECSCPELDELVQLARDAGAYGSRLTGAGWGGCTVSLVAETEVESFITKIKNAYGPYAGLEGEKLHEVIFATKPSSGACVYKFEDRD